MTTQRSQLGSRVALAFLALLFGARLWILLASHLGLSGDAFAYVKEAQYLLAHGSLPPLRVQPHGFLLLIAPILYLSGDNFGKAMLCVNVAMDSAVVLSLALLAWQLLAPPRRAWLRWAACAAILVEPFTATMVTSAYTEQFCQIFLFFGVRSLYRSNSTNGRLPTPLVGPLLFGVAALLRSELLLLNLLILLAYFVMEARRRSSLKAVLRAAVVGATIYATVLVSMLAYQYASTRELGFVRVEYAYHNYQIWMRTWFSAEHDHNRFSFGFERPNWPGMRIDEYPERAFDSQVEREQVRELLQQWQAHGYTDHVANGFLEIARERAQRHPFRQYIWNPVARMVHYWFNLDGAQVVLQTLQIKRPISTAIVGATLFLRLLFLSLAGIGFFAVWWRPRQLTIQVGEIGRAQLGSVALILRTLLLGALGIFFAAGLMENRFVSIVFPFLIVLALFGVAYACVFLSNRRDQTRVIVS